MLSPDVKLCECGCGRPAPIARQGDSKRGHVKGQPCRFVAGHNQMRAKRTSGYVARRVPGHPKARNGCMDVHVLVAERALGRYMPDGAEVHHVDGNHLNNANSNLVICQDKGYHKLLHVRARIVAAGGDPDSERICSACKVLRPLSAFHRMSNGKAYGLQNRCKECVRILQVEYRSRMRPEGASHAA